jgi:uncharacterized membrane protein YtjA (UPF0391 family)
MKSTPDANPRLPLVLSARRSWTRFCFVQSQEELAVLYYALMFLVVALIAAALGISGVAGVASQIAWVLFIIGIVLLVVNFLTGNRPRSVV